MMEQNSTQPAAARPILDRVRELGMKAFDPDQDVKCRADHQSELDALLGRTRTIVVMSLLNKLIQPGDSPEWLRGHFISILASLPLRSDGVRSALEFVFSVHPSSSLSAADAARPQKQGANITQEALSMATRLLATPPAAFTPEQWFPGIAPQLLALLDGQDGFELTKAASYVIGFGILGRKKFGAPGAAGWSVFAEPMLRCISPERMPPAALDQGVGPDGVVDLSSKPVIVSSADLEVALRRLQGLIISHPNPGLTKRLLSPLLLPLWSILSWRAASSKIEDRYSRPARNLLKIHLRLTSTTEQLMLIIRKLLYNGPRDAGKLRWAYSQTADERIHVVDVDKARDGDVLDGNDWTQIGPKSDALMDLIQDIAFDDDIPSLFIELFRRWTASKKRTTSGVVITMPQRVDEDPVAELMEVSVLQKMMEKFPDKIIGRPEHILSLVQQVLAEADANADDESATAVALSLLNLVVSTPGFRRAGVDAEMLGSIEAALSRIGNSADSDTSATARNLSLLLKFRDEVEDEVDSTHTATKRQVEDRKTYNLGMSYITQADSPTPVRSEGLNLIQGLIQKASPILDIPALLVLMSSLLDENEDFINLRVVKIFTLLATRHPKAVTKELVERYVDADERSSVDHRLRFGEALSQVIERLGETFSGDTADQVGDALLSTAGRRGYRPKTEAKQAKAERLRAMKAKRAVEAGDDAMDDDGEPEETDEEKARHEILNQIIDGWGSKRGSEDVRIRASALSIFTMGIETNVAGLGASRLSNAVDLCLNVLALEPEMEKGILRRAAIILILGFVTALEKAKQTGRRLGFGLTPESQDSILRILRYIAATDNDGLVKQHAQDVVESLENWQASSLLPTEEPQTSSLSRLAGLSVNPSRDGRPRIEEVE